MIRNPFLFGTVPPPRGATQVERLVFVRQLADRSAVFSVVFFAVVAAVGIGLVGLIAAAICVLGGVGNHVSITRKIQRLNGA